MSRHLTVGLLALLPVLAAMPCLCAPEEAQSCCCSEESKQAPECCCTIKDKPEYTVETPTLPVDLDIAIPVEISEPLPLTGAVRKIFAIDTGPPDHSVSVLRL